ncbi:hypothetical protein JAAARDRAFT_451220 [Jaapia argillacea MUCL 33604]|uniref:Peptidase C14 caspase domain-containing protein n=1 Tax=Jaapia argillacea MUCL 33604 TaxID=933084 RepID=A0A067QF95_9AGAM|nr:hypothetical protein JAAARDRAFT_451220 [Jaapia argillacea MUCL 33604]
MIQLWALIVGVGTYSTHSDCDLVGPTKDVDKVHKYLREKMNVPSSNIRVLKDEQANREEIISSFSSHLISNELIKWGDAILFHFSGHGSRAKAPKNWPVVEEERDADDDGGEDGDSEARRMLEIILPHDEGEQIIGSDRKVCGIPDRTLGVLLNKAARAHGHNITVVLDCCHSGHGTRLPNDDHGLVDGEEYRIRGIDPSKVAPLWEGVDYAILNDNAEEAGDGGSGRIHPSDLPASLRTAFTGSSAKSHILMAACSQKEEALDCRGGGLFTTYWLKALCDPDLHPRSYAEMMKYIKAAFERLAARNPDTKVKDQHPRCEGTSCDRLAFEETAVDKRLFTARVVDNGGLCAIDAGELHGIRSDTVFELFDLKSGSQARRELGSATATEVFPIACIARPLNSLEVSQTHIYALVSRWPYSLRFAVRNTQANSTLAQGLYGSLERRIQMEADGGSYHKERVEDANEADLVLEVGNRGVSLQRRDQYMRGLATRMPLVESKYVDEYFPEILDDFARFNYYLGHHNPVEPFASQVQVELHLLEEDSDCDFFGDSKLVEPMKLGKEIVFQNREATVVHSTSNGYAFVLRMDGAAPAPLYPHLTYFEPGTYQIENWYSPFEVDKPTLHPGTSLQIGGSPESERPFTFTVRECINEDLDTVFIKVWLLSSPTQMDFLDQDPVIGFDEYGRQIERRRGERSASSDEWSPSENRGGWDSITLKITVIGRN